MVSESDAAHEAAFTARVSMSSETNAAQAVEMPSIPAVAGRKSVLIMEDEPLLGNILRQRLEKEGFNVTLACDGKEGLKILRNTIPDLILLDIILPKMSGFEVLQTINSDPELASKGAPVVIISNLGQEGDLEKAKSLGVVGYFIKAQLSFEELVGQVKNFFEMRKDKT